MKTLLEIFKMEFMIDKEIKEAGYTWKSLSELLGENPSNFKRKLVQNVERLNKWLEPLGLQIQIAPKSESGEEKNKRKRTSEKRVKELEGLKKYARDQFSVGLIEAQIKYWNELQ